MVHFENLSQYAHIKNLVIFDMVGIVATFFSFMIMGFILFRSSQVAAFNRQSRGIRNLMFLDQLRSRALLGQPRSQSSVSLNDLEQAEVLGD